MNITRAATMLCTLTLLPVASSAVGPEPTAFLVQGFLSAGGAPVTGLVDLEAELWDGAAGGAQVGTAVSVADHPVTGGRFEVELDFGDVFTGTPLWLELRARPAGAGAFATLEPRRRLWSAPHAAHAHRAAVADLAVSAAEVGGLGPDDLTDWTQMTGIPPDLADGDDDALGGLACTEGQLARWDGAAWVCGDDAGVDFSRTWVVGPVGDPLANGSALLAAMDAIPTPGGAGEAGLLKIEPGRYDLGSQSLVMKPWVDVEGSGRLATVITSTVCGVVGSETGTVVAAADAALRHITVENLCAGSTVIGTAVYSEADRFTLESSLLRAAGDATTNTALSSYGDGLTVADSEIRAFSSDPLNGSVGIEVTTGGELRLRNVTAEGHGTYWNSKGADVLIRNPDPGTDLGAQIEGCVFRSSNTSPTYFPTGVAIQNQTLLEVSLSDSLVSATGPFIGPGVFVHTDGGLTRLTRVQATGIDVGVDFNDRSPAQARAIFTDVSATGSDSGIELSSNVSTLVSIHGGILQGSTASVREWGSGEVRAHLSHTRLLGPVALLPATSTCTAVTDGTPTFHATTCP